ncbi:uncharacterized protein LOC126905916 [Daktulosphaira vitifoliae]|uniref:uncharacterized protein LOC126905916 n=1 Tax=Daktulosphaira vitifoliae TaxID=58002 RepID=UPI0021AAF159|nr:uncharacterized protein LOC126905916 [Daktulosphaira vitifoliae]
MSVKDIARQILSGYVDRETQLENEIKELLIRKKKTLNSVVKDDFFKIKRDLLEKQKKNASNRNATFLKDLGLMTAKLRASMACNDLTDQTLAKERKKYIEYLRQSKNSAEEEHTT